MAFERIREVAARQSLTEVVARNQRGVTLAALHVGLAVAAADFVFFALALWFASYGAPATGHVGEAGKAAQAAGGAVGAVLLLALARGYRITALADPKQILAALAATGVAAAALAASGPATAELVGIRLAVVALVVSVHRAIVFRLVFWMRGAGLLTRRAVLAGGGARARQLLLDLAVRQDTGIRICAIFDDRGDDRSAPQVLGVPKIGRFSDLARFCRSAEIDLVIVTLPLSAEARIGQQLLEFSVLPIPVYLSEFAQDREFGPRGGAGAVLREALPASFLPDRRLTKRVFDLLFGGLALAVLWPVMLAVAIAVRLDSPGPILFRQKRHGFNNREITILKFRSMFAEAADPAAVRVVTRGDARVTRVGRVLRRTSLDELPQLFNVLGGSLSLVGPRPHAIRAKSSRNRSFEEIVERYSARHRLPPGMTGLAQISGWRGEIAEDRDLSERVACDLRYIENWSVWLDLLILLKTPFSLLRSRGAY